MSEPPLSVREHMEAGRWEVIDGLRIFVREQGKGQPVLLVHGVPSSSYLYRKMIPLLAESGRRAIAFDFPGMGLSDKPTGVDYDWHALAGWMTRLVDQLDLKKIHLVVHDIGGPIGMEWAIANQNRVASITILNTLMDLEAFNPPFPMWLYRVPFLRQLVFWTQSPIAFQPLMRRIGVFDASAADLEMVRSYLWLLRQNGGRQSFLAIMNGFDLTRRHSHWLAEGMRRLDVPRQVVWGEHENAIPRHQLDYIVETLAVMDITMVPARHFLQEDQAGAIVDAIVSFPAK